MQGIKKQHTAHHTLDLDLGADWMDIDAEMEVAAVTC